MAEPDYTDIVDVDEFTETVQTVTTGQKGNATRFKQAVQALANRTRFLFARGGAFQAVTLADQDPYDAQDGEWIYHFNFAPLTINAPTSPAAGMRFGVSLILQVGIDDPTVTIAATGGDIYDPFSEQTDYTQVELTTRDIRLVTIGWQFDGTQWFPFEVSSSDFPAARVITPTQITSNQNNYDPDGLVDADEIRLSADSSNRKITGIEASSLRDGRNIKTLVNVGSNPFLLMHESSSSTTTNRLTITGGNDLVMQSGDSVAIVRDETTTRWRVFPMLPAGGTVPLTGAANTLALAHTNKRVGVSHTTISVLTVPANSSVPFPVGTVIPVVQVGQGSVEILAAGGVGINTYTWFQFVTAGVNAIVYLRKIATDTWELDGNLQEFVHSIRPSQITSNQNDYDPLLWQDAEIVKLRTDASRDITGFASPEPVGTNYTYYGKHIKHLINDGAQNWVLKHENAGSSVANRIKSSTAADVTVTPNQKVIIVYDDTASRWRV